MFAKSGVKILLAIALYLQIAPATATYRSAKLELQMLKDKEIPFSGASCSVADKKDRLIFVSELGTANAWIKMHDRVIKLTKSKQSKRDFYTAKDLTVAVDYGQKKTVIDSGARYHNVRVDVVDRGRKFNISATGNCGC
jgi:hypothetical protein